MTRSTRAYPTQQNLRLLYRWDARNQSFFSIRRQRSLHPWLDKAGYRYTNYKSLRFQQSRLVWIYHNGAIPDNMEIDHIDGNRSNDDISNLRVCTHAENARNRSAPIALSGFRGVNLTRSGRYHATICDNGHMYSIGTYSTAHLAAQWYDAAAKVLHGDYRRTNFGAGLVDDTELIWTPQPKRNKASRYRGVVMTRNRIKARISDGTKQIWLGSHATEQDAARAYDIAATIRGRRTNVDLGLLEPLCIDKAVADIAS